jgi:prephenate dehydratase
LTSALAVAYPGREGAHSAAACDRLFPDAELVPLPSFSDVIEAASAGAVDYGVLPIESSLVGPVAETHDLLYGSTLSITGEAVIPIRHCLVGPEVVPLERVREIRSHPVALDQCRMLLAAMPWAAAIASERAAKLYGLTVIAGDVGDHKEAYTRFVSVAPYTRLDRTDERWRTAFTFVTNHQPGALVRAIEPFARHGIDLVQLVSRPIPHTPWRYRFDAVLGGHPLDDVVAAALAEVATKTAELRVFGSYPPA